MPDPLHEAGGSQKVFTGDSCAGTVMPAKDFYDLLAPYYHYIYSDWLSDLKRQARVLRSVMREFWGPSIKTILDASCGIGTQSIGLARLGYKVTGADISPRAIARAKREIEERGLHVELLVADMRKLAAACQQEFDLVLSCDNSVPHLLSDEEIETAFGQFLQCIRPGGGCVISVRDYATMKRKGMRIVPRTVHSTVHGKIIMFDVWRFHDSFYDMNIYIVKDKGQQDCDTEVLRTQYYCVTIGRLEELMLKAGFVDVQTLRGRYFQPLIIGTKKPVR